MATPFHIISDSVPIPASKLSLDPAGHPRPEWLRVKFFNGPNYQDLKRIMRTLGLNTVCESARCPNMGECWEHRTATFMILGNICTRACGFCAVPSGKPAAPPDEQEPERVAEAAQLMGLRYAVVTSVNRDDQPDGGAAIFARTIAEIRGRVPGCKVEVLIPDFRGDCCRPFPFYPVRAVIRRRASPIRQARRARQQFATGWQLYHYDG